jgi:hypothetical protein
LEIIRQRRKTGQKEKNVTDFCYRFSGPDTLILYQHMSAGESEIETGQAKELPILLPVLTADFWAQNILMVRVGR